MSAHLWNAGSRRSMLKTVATMTAMAWSDAWAQPRPTRSRWHDELAAFAQADRISPPQPGGVLFLGSSSIRLWKSLPQDFPQLPVVVNRGFGGSTMEECREFAAGLVLPCRPAHVLVYAGENDLAEGRSPLQVLDSFRGFVAFVRGALPATRISYIAIKPSPLRIGLMPLMRQANARVADDVATRPDAGFIDVFTPMLDNAGQPRAELFDPDRLHLNPSGYRLWRTLIAPHLQGSDLPRRSAPAAAADAAAPVR